MALHIHCLDANSYKVFYRENRIDPVTHNSFQKDDEIVFCAVCQSAWLAESWKLNQSKCSCGCSNTLPEPPWRKFFKIIDTLIPIIVGNNENIKNLTEALAIAQPHEHIFIRPGIYTESQLLIDKPITIQGWSQKPDTPIILKIPGERGIAIRSDNIILQDMIIKHVRQGGTLFDITNGSLAITNGKIIAQNTGCYLDHGTLEIRNTECITQDGPGIFALNSRHISLNAGKIHSTNSPAIVISQSSHLEISDDTVVETENDIHVGIAVDNTSNYVINSPTVEGTESALTDNDIFAFNWLR